MDHKLSDPESNFKVLKCNFKVPESSFKLVKRNFKVLESNFKVPESICKALISGLGNALRPPPPPYNAEESEKIACRQPGSADRLGCMQLIQPI